MLRHETLERGSLDLLGPIERPGKALHFEHLSKRLKHLFQRRDSEATEAPKQP